MKKIGKGILFILFIAYVLFSGYLVVITFINMDEDFWQWGELPFQNNRSIESGFELGSVDISTKPNERTSKT
jgi:hypothetical protein